MEKSILIVVLACLCLFMFLLLLVFPRSQGFSLEGGGAVLSHLQGKSPKNNVVK